VFRFRTAASCAPDNGATGGDRTAPLVGVNASLTTGLIVGQITAPQRVNIAAGVRVFTTNSAGAAQDSPFFLAVFC
jgi:hypothetical protein